MQVWPFKPRDQFTESLEWKTDIFEAKAGEQRQALRIAPRRAFQIDHLMSEQEYSAARAMIREAETFLVPDWPQSTKVGAVSPGSSVAINYDTTATDLQAGDQVVIWESVYNFEAADVDSVTAGGIVVASVTGTYTNARVVPARQAHIPEGLSVNRSAGGIIQASVAPEVFDNRDLGATTYSQYRGHDVLPTCPVVSSGSFDESVVWPLSAFDNETGVPHYIRQRDIPNARFQMRWHEFAGASAYALRQWLHSRRGRQKAFWYSSWGKDLDLAADIGSLDTTIRVYALPGITGVGRSSAFDIEIKAGDGIRYYRQVTGLAVGPEVNGRATLDLTIDSALGVDQLVSDTDRISFLRCARFDADRIELQHRAAAGMSVSIPVMEIPVP